MRMTTMKNVAEDLRNLMGEDHGIGEIAGFLLALFPFQSTCHSNWSTTSTCSMSYMVQSLGSGFATE
ncbi:hypothetical protein A4A49_21498 [Nicotiana attenuata]|uniref:Uncharacterized protein n=1 Tax=Nicotiana attenuata TaxID=49451 RepID=A0A314KZM0_NICAT|nr:hypothetical protein A4A49_21498 [Nicotiana attenuata]